MLPFQITEGGSFTAAGSTANIQLSTAPDMFWLANRTDWGVASGAVAALQSYYRNGMANDVAKAINQSASSTWAFSGADVTSGGFTFINSSNPPTYAALAGTTITGNAGTFVVSMTSTTGIAVGDTVRLYQTTGELQIAGYAFQVTAVSTNSSITLGYMASSGMTFASNASACQVLKFYPGQFYPRARRIANITQAAQAVVYFTQPNDFTPGERVGMRIPSSMWGMTQLNNVEARVLSVTNSATVSSITIDQNTSGYTAFSFPTSAQAAAGVSPALVVPSASAVVPQGSSATIAQQPPGTNLLDAFDNRNIYYMHCGANVITNTTGVYDWVSYKFDKFTAA